MSADSCLVLHAHGFHGACVGAQSDLQSRWRDRLRNPDPYETEVDQVATGRQRVFELHGLGWRELVSPQTDQLSWGRILGVGQDDRRFNGSLGCLEILLDVDWRNLECGTDVVVAESDVVLREIVCQPEIKPDQVADRVVVLLAVQSSDDHRHRALCGAALRFDKVVLDPVNDALHVLRRRLGHVCRRHDLPLQSVEHTALRLRGGQCVRLALERIERDARLWRFLEVALDATDTELFAHPVSRHAVCPENPTTN